MDATVETPYPFHLHSMVLQNCTEDFFCCHQDFWTGASQIVQNGEQEVGQLNGEELVTAMLQRGAQDLAGIHHLLSPKQTGPESPQAALSPFPESFFPERFRRPGRRGQGRAYRINETWDG